MPSESRKRSAVRTAARVLFALAVLVPLLAVTASIAPSRAFADQSSDGDFSVTKTGNKNNLAAGGEDVTFTYTVVNNTGGTQYFRGGKDDLCSNVQYVSGMRTDLLNYQYIPAHGTATFECTTKVTQTETNTATFTFADSYFTILISTSWSGTSTATAKLTTTVQPYPGISCDSILWSSVDSSLLNNFNTQWGTISTDGSMIAARGSVEVTGATQGSSALAINPLDPSYVYFVPRTTENTSSNRDGLYRVRVNADGTVGSATLVAGPQSATATNRLGFDAAGNLFSFAGDGHLYRMAAGSSTWNDAGLIATSGQSGAPSLSSLPSGDLAVDGLGNMWFIGSDSSNSYLYTITASELGKSNPTAAFVGKMGSGQFNGLAFGSNGQLYASSLSGNASAFYTVDISKGTATAVRSNISASATSGFIADLTSCAMPRPVLHAEKTSTSTSITPGSEVTYSITISNTGNLAASGVTFQDGVPANTTYVRSTLNGASVGTAGTNYWASAVPVKGSNAATSGVIAPGDQATITVTYKVADQVDPSVTQVCNQGSLTVTGSSVFLTDDPAKSGASDSSCVQVAQPKIAIDKTSPVTVLSSIPQQVRYDYAVTSTGTESLNRITVSDDKCSPVTGILTSANPARNVGDTNQNDQLDQGETWNYTCTASLSAKTTNTATATGTGVASNQTVTANDTWTVSLPVPAAKVVKTVVAAGAAGPGTAKTLQITQGDAVDYYYQISAAGTQEPLTSVTLSDDKCSSPIYVSGDANNDKLVQSGETWLFKCSQVLTVDTVNVATLKASGNVSGSPVSATDTANVTTVAPVTRTVTVKKLGSNCDVGVPTCPLTGAGFSVYSADPVLTGSTGTALTAQANGSTFLTGSLRVDRDYWLVETKAPVGFQLLAQPVKFRLTTSGATITSGGTTGTVIADSANFAISVTDVTAPPLPKAGGNGARAFLLIGLLALALAGLSWRGFSPPYRGRRRAMT